MSLQLQGFEEREFALRVLLTPSVRKSPGFATVAVLTLALGIGFNTAIFSLLNALTRPLNVPEPDRLVRIFSGRSGASYEMSYPNYLDLCRSAQSFSELAVYSPPQPMSLGLVGQEGAVASERVWGTVVSGNYFTTLGVRAEVGRTFAPDEDHIPDSRPVIVISHRLWTDKFNGAPNVIGLTIKLNGYPFQVIGVAPDRMLRAGLLLSNDVWVPMMMEGEAMPGQSFKLTNRNETFLTVIGRLRLGVTLAQALYERLKVYYDRVGADFFRTMGTPLLEGRDFTERDVNSLAPVAVVNQTFATSFWPGQNPIGKRLKLNSPDSPWIEVVGLVPTGKYLSLGESSQRHLFLAGNSSGLVIHTAGDPHQYMQAVRAAVQRLDPNLTVANMETMNEHLGLALYPARMSASLLGLFSVLGLSLAMLGLYGLLAFVVRRRTHEVGIRIALGATKRDVLSVVMRQGVLLVALGMALGLGAAYAASRVVASFLYGVAGNDLFTFAQACFLLVAVTLVAMYLPARRAARVDPMIALRYE